MIRVFKHIEVVRRITHGHHIFPFQAEVRRNLNVRKVPTYGRAAVWDSEADANFTQLPALINAEKCGDTTALRSGSIGEVFGISGLVGAGRTELARAILGIDKLDSGEVFVKGKKVKYRKFAHAIKDGLGLIPEDRKLQGLIQTMSIKKNTSLVNLDGVIRNGFIDYALEAKIAKEYADKLTLVRPNEDVEVQFLSGGNQQKVVIAKWLFRGSDILFLDEPTRGIDVGAKAEIYRLINQLVKEGKAYPCFTTEEELDELQAINKKEEIKNTDWQAEAEAKKAAMLAGREFTMEEVKAHLEAGDPFVLRILAPGKSSYVRARLALPGWCYKKPPPCLPAKADSLSYTVVLDFIGQGSAYGSFDLGGVHFIYLDASYYREGGEEISYDRGNYKKAADTDLPLLPKEELDYERKTRRIILCGFIPRRGK